MEEWDVQLKIELEKRVQEIVARTLALEVEKIKLEDRIEDLTEDSIQLFELILAFEKEFKAEADYTELMEIETVEDVVEYLKKRGLGQ